jgi:hypothetical protein
VDHLSHGGRAVRAEHRLRRLDLQLEAQPPRLDAVGLLQPLAQAGHRLHLRGRADLGQGHDEPIRQAPVAEQGAEKEIERAHPAPAGGGLEALEADAAERRRVARRDERARGTQGVGVLLAVAAVAVTVLEVDPQVLDGLALQLAAHAVVQLGHQVGRQAEPVGELGRRRAVLGQHGQRLRPPLAGQAGVAAVGRDVDGVNRLAHARVARITRRELVVGVLELTVEPRVVVIAKSAGQLGHGATLPRSRPGRSGHRPC